MATRAVSLLLPLLLLLLLPLAERRCVASPPPEGPTGAAADPSPADSLVNLLWKTLNSAVRSVVAPAVSELEEGLQTRLTHLAVTLAGLQDQQEAQNATLLRQLQALETDVATGQSRLESRLEAVQAHIESKLEKLQTQLESRLAASSPPQTPPRDCSDLPADTASDVHLLHPGLRQPVPAFCDTETSDGGGAWTVIQRRADIQPRQDFYLGWQAYKWGFGTLDGEFWWGLEHLFHTTSLLDRRYQLRIDLEDFVGEKRFALYQDFRISSEADGYRLHVMNYSGDATDSLRGHNGKAFSTKDKDQDKHAGSCAQMFKGGWWYEKCHWSNLNGLYLGGDHSSYADGINWQTWKGYHHSLKSVEMKIRPDKKL